MYGGQGQIWKVAGLWEISLKFLDLTPMEIPVVCNNSVYSTKTNFASTKCTVPGI